MAKEDLKKFHELITTDPEFQEKFKAAAEKYDGEPDEEAVFEKVVLPLGKEHGLSATYDEFRDYIEAVASGAENGELAGELSEDELTQVAGGKGGGAGIGKCAIFGVGIGVGGADTPHGSGSHFGVGICIGIGAGAGSYKCFGSGEADDLVDL